MNIIIESSLRTLKKSQLLLENLTDETLCNATISPYYSSIGSHLRHILDFYNCIFNLTTEGIIDLTARSRNKAVESKCSCTEDYLNTIIQKLTNSDYDMDAAVNVVDDLGLGKTEIKYTYGAVFSQANSHTIHHYAIINYLFDRLGIILNDDNFGYNPTTPKKTIAHN